MENVTWDKLSACPRRLRAGATFRHDDRLRGDKLLDRKTNVRAILSGNEEAP
jgi:hypothetical protein